ncbi:DUF3995 domain-containing protein [Kutzneria buriramensis]|uniref:Uncharacterized protein DUF3995 n=1 Tax=Kutzneria buriramensis TaxID=1045776 RepID=A0A3E0HYV5_9PSEU|nr:DUF3995 domain-containing protein [Kutzneria buriramensis]REH51653.1 uncharacterized protein DUF3995 [Kutzneria buriramensis]
MWGKLAACWCALFGALHVYWALGGGIGLAASAGPDLAAGRPLLFVLFGLWGVAVLLAAGAAFCLLRHPWQRVGQFVGAILVARAVLVEITLLTGIADVGADERFWSLVLWNPWFLLGGVLWLLAFNRSPRRRRRARAGGGRRRRAGSRSSDRPR